MIAFVDHDDGSDRHVVARVSTVADPRRFALFVFDGDTRPDIGFPVFDHHLARLAGHRVELFLHGLAFGEVTEFDRPGHLGQNRDGERVPFRQQRFGLQRLPVGSLSVWRRR